MTTFDTHSPTLPPVAPVRRVRRSGTAPLTYRPGLDGLRALAVAAVIAYHLGHLPGGFVGVDLFFVLSGWLITSLLLRTTPGTARELVTWWQRRITRLTPAVALVVIATFVVFATTPGVTLDGVATMTWWQNWLLILEGTSYWSGAPSPLRHTWSLSIEEQFYLVWPALLVGLTVLARRSWLGRRQLIGAVAAVAATASFVWAAWLATTTDELSRVYFGTDTRAGGLLLGCAAAALLRGGSRADTARAPLTTCAVVALGVLGAACLVLDPSRPSTYTGGLLISSIAAVVLIVAAARTGPLERVLSIPPLRWIGVRSYGLYLWSWPVQLLVEREWTDAPRWGRTALVVALTVVLAALSQRLVEEPLRRPTGTWAATVARRRAVWLVGLVLLVVTGWYATSSADPVDDRMVDAAESSDIALAEPVPAAPEATVAPEPEQAATEAALGYHPLPATGVRAMIMGDSQAFMAGWMLGDDERPARFASLDTRAILGCGVLTHDGWGHVDPGSGRVVRFPECVDVPAAVQLGLQGQPDLVIWPVGAFEYWGWDRDGVRLDPMSGALADELVSSMVNRGAQVTAAGARLALVQWVCPGPNPAAGEEPGEDLRRTPE